MEDGILRLQGAQEPTPDKWVSLATIKFIGGLQTQRSAFASIDTRYSTKYLGGKPDALIAGQNVEISNALTLQRRPGLLPYGPANIPSPSNFFDWQLATTGDINLVIDTESGGGDNNAGSYGAVFRYSTTNSGIYFNKAAQSNQTNFFDVVNTMYMGDGVDLFKCVGPNLLVQSNTFGTGSGTSFSIQSPWTDANVFALTTGQTDPLGGTSATQLTWGTTGGGAYLQQTVTPNYTPVAQNTFTFSLWMQANSSSALSVSLEIADQNGNIQTTTFALTQTWTKYQVTTTMKSTSTSITVSLNSPTATSPTMNIYGAQLEIGGPATTTQITTTKAQGVYRWGIQAPSQAPTAIASTTQIGSPWQPNTAYQTAIYALTACGNASAGSTVYTGAFPNGGSNNLSGRTFLIAGFSSTVNNGTFACTASTNTSITLSNANGVAQSNQTATATLSLTLTSVTAGTGHATYFGTIIGGGGNAYAGYAVTIQNFANAGNNGNFYITNSTGSSITVINTAAINETPATSPVALILGQAVTDSNGDMEVATASGTSGGSQPVWSQTPGGTTADGTNTIFLKQTVSGSSESSSTITVAFPSNVTASDSLVAFVASNTLSAAGITVSDTQSNGWTLVTTAQSGPFGTAIFWVKSAAGGATSVTATNSQGTGVWLGLLETSSLASLDGNSSTSAASVAAGSGTFQTGSVTTTTNHDLFLSFYMVVAGNQNQNTTVTPPSGFSQVIANTAVQMPQGFMCCSVDYEYVTSLSSINPQWKYILAAGGSRECGISAAFIANSTTTLVWTNYGPIGLSATIGFQYYYAFMNAYTGHVSNVSPISSSTGVIAGVSVTITGVGMQITPSGTYGQDPQVDTIALFRNTDGGPLFYQLATFANPGTTTSAGTWTFTDTTPSTQLNTSIFAPIADLNSLPPAGLVNMEYFEGRLWGSVNNILYYNTSSDNASLVNVSQNGVPAESWDPVNFLPFNAPIVRSLAVGNGLIVFTTTDTWLVTGQNLLTGGFAQTKALAGHGLRFYNAVAVDGNTMYVYTGDRQALQISPNSGSIEVGFPIGDLLEANLNPTSAYIVRHVAGSRDNAVYYGDGTSGWYRLNPNQQGASMAGEATPVWSPYASFQISIGGIKALASVEVSAGVVKLLVGQNKVGPVLVRDLNTFTDNGTPYQWTATIGSILMTTPGKLAELDSVIMELNNIGGSAASLPEIFVLIDEISGNFEQLLVGVYDPPQFYPVQNPTSVLSERFYLSQGSVAPVGRHMQVQLNGQAISGVPATTKDELLALTIRGCLVPEQI